MIYVLNYYNRKLTTQMADLILPKWRILYSPNGDLILPKWRSNKVQRISDEPDCSVMGVLL